MALKMPAYLKKRIVPNERLFSTRSLIKRLGINTICESARCPNLVDCFSNGCVTILIMGKSCTRACAFCSVSSLETETPDDEEPHRVACAVETLGLKYVVITSPARDDLLDGGSSHYARTIIAVKKRAPEAVVEVLVPDFAGDVSAIGTVVDAGPAVFGHNVETVERLYNSVRPSYSYRKSLAVIRAAKKFSGTILTKSSIMVGIGETESEVIDALSDLRSAGCDIVTIGQYLRPGVDNIEVDRLVDPAEFERYLHEADRLSFRSALGGPFVRSSYMAGVVYRKAISEVKNERCNSSALS